MDTHGVHQQISNTTTYIFPSSTDTNLWGYAKKSPTVMPSFTSIDFVLLRFAKRWSRCMENLAASSWRTKQSINSLLTLTDSPIRGGSLSAWPLDRLSSRQPLSQTQPPSQLNHGNTTSPSKSIFQIQKKKFSGPNKTTRNLRKLGREEERSSIEPSNTSITNVI